MSADGPDRLDAQDAAAPAALSAPRGLVFPAASGAGTPALLLRDPRRGVVWANAEALALIGAPTLAAAAPSRLAALIAALDAADPPNATLPTAQGFVSGRLERRPTALSDGGIGARAAFWPEAPAHDGAALKAAAFDAAPLPLAVLDAGGRAVAANAAFAAAVDLEALEADPALGPRRRDGRAARMTATPIGAEGERVLAPRDGVAADGETLIAATALARLAHEFRSPLTAVLGFAEFLRENLADLSPDRAQAYLDDLTLAATRMRRLADDLVAIGAGGDGLTVAETDLDALLDEALRLAAPAARARGVRLEAPSPARLAALVDADALSRAVANLLDNAIRHGAGPARGTVRLSLGDLGRDGGAEIEVADDGPGLDAEALDAALALYGRRSTHGAGAAGGLGLPIVREIVEAHGGTLVIDTAPGEGFRARIALPPARVHRGAPPRRR